MNRQLLEQFEDLLDQVVDQASTFAIEHNQFLDTFSITNGLPDRLPTNFGLEDITFEDGHINMKYDRYVCGDHETDHFRIPLAWLDDDSDWKQQLIVRHELAMKKRRQVQEQRRRMEELQKKHEDIRKEREERKLLKTLQAKYPGDVK